MVPWSQLEDPVVPREDAVVAVAVPEAEPIKKHKFLLVWAEAVIPSSNSLSREHVVIHSVSYFLSVHPRSTSAVALQDSGNLHFDANLYLAL